MMDCFQVLLSNSTCTTTTRHRCRRPPVEVGAPSRRRVLPAGAAAASGPWLRRGPRARRQKTVAEAGAGAGAGEVTEQRRRQRRWQTFRRTVLGLRLRMLRTIRKLRMAIRIIAALMKWVIPWLPMPRLRKGGCRERALDRPRISSSSFTCFVWAVTVYMSSHPEGKSCSDLSRVLVVNDSLGRSVNGQIGIGSEQLRRRRRRQGKRRRPRRRGKRAWRRRRSGCPSAEVAAAAAAGACTLLLRSTTSAVSATETLPPPNVSRKKWSRQAEKWTSVRPWEEAAAAAAAGWAPQKRGGRRGRGLHSSTFRLNVSTF